MRPQLLRLIDHEPTVAFLVEGGDVEPLEGSEIVRTITQWEGRPFLGGVHRELGRECYPREAAPLARYSGICAPETDCRYPTREELAEQEAPIEQSGLFYQRI